jgi:hypothetical protein
LGPLVHCRVSFQMSAVATEALSQATEAQEGQDNQEGDEEDPGVGAISITLSAQATLPHSPPSSTTTLRIARPVLGGPGHSVDGTHFKGPGKTSKQQSESQHLTPLGQLQAKDQERGRTGYGHMWPGRRISAPPDTCILRTQASSHGAGHSSHAGLSGRNWGQDSGAGFQACLQILVPSYCFLLGLPFLISKMGAINTRQAHWPGVGLECCSGHNIAHLTQRRCGKTGNADLRSTLGV